MPFLAFYSELTLSLSGTREGGGRNVVSVVGTVLPLRERAREKAVV